ncbi:MAG: GAF domain-containing protein [Chloroflexi bacterium]|nr:GAF domain-containing protein [Chloroflexota bacterium]
MGTNSDHMIQKVTSELNDEILRELLLSGEETYRPVPSATNDVDQPVWRVRFEMAYDSSVGVGLDINGEITIGRQADPPAVITLVDPEEGDQLGVSRRHAILRPTPSRLYVVDLGSTNGTRLNGRSIGVNMPYSLSDGDRLILGRLEVVVRIIKRPSSAHTSLLHAKADLADTLPAIARTITAQLDVDDVLKAAMDTAISYTAADEVTVWLVDEQTGELFLEAGRGLDDEQVRRLPVNDTMPGKVIETGKPLRVNRQQDGEQIKVKTGYLVEAVIYVPLTLAEVTFGVLSAAHREPGKLFTQREEKLMQAIADYTAVAIQNARRHQALKSALARRSKVLTALKYALSSDMRAMLNSTVGYAGLLESYDLDEDTTDIAHQVVLSADDIAQFVEKLVEATALSENAERNHAPCDLVDVVSRAVEDLRPEAEAKDIHLDFQLIGDPYIIQGNGTYLYRGVLNLIDNAVRYTPAGGQVSVALAYWQGDIIIRVLDSGVGIPEADLPYLFDHYFRGKESTGIGLGLEIVRTTVEAHRGTVTARNNDDVGAEFIIKLPTTLRLT